MQQNQITKDLYNAIQKFKSTYNDPYDASKTIELLQQKQYENRDWKYSIKVENEHLSCLFWMSSDQTLLWNRFHDVHVINY